MPLLTLLAWSATAAAQQTSEFVPEGADCGEVQVIMGTAGQRNAANAVQTNAATYSASAAAARNLVRSPREPDSDWKPTFFIDMNSTYGAARVPVFHAANDSRPDECLDRNRVAIKPFDMHAANFGFAARKGNFGFVFSSSFTWAAPGPGDQFFRMFMSTSVAPFYILSAAAIAPLLDLAVPGPLDFSGPTSGMAADWLVGATYKAGSVDLGAAYLASRGGYLSGYEARSGAYAFAALRPGQKPLYELGVDRFSPAALGAGGAARALGLSSVAYQDIPFFIDPDAAAEARATDDRATLDRLVYQLRVGSVKQQNLAQILDVQARYRIAPDPSLSELVVGLHTPGYHRPRGDTDGDAPTWSVLAQGGVVTTPTVWSEGSGPERLISARAGVRAHAETDDIPLLFQFLLLTNDPDQLQLYPFARNAVSYNLYVGTNL